MLRGREFRLKNRSASLFLLFLAVSFSPLLRAQEDFLKIEASAIPRKLSRGEEGVIFLKLGLQEGITVSPHPDFIIELKPSEGLVFPKNFYAASDLGIDAVEADGEVYLDLEEPIKIPFTVSPEAKKGSHILEGRIKYFARSKKEGWCVRNTAKFFVTCFTRSSVVKKKP
jgi:hypothetical protein